MQVYLFDGEGELIRKPLKKRDDLSPGLVIAVPTLFGYAKMTVAEHVPPMELWAESKNYVAGLAFATDDRKCWVSTMLINKALWKGQFTE